MRGLTAVGLAGWVLRVGWRGVAGAAVEVIDRMVRVVRVRPQDAQVPRWLEPHDGCLGRAREAVRPARWCAGMGPKRR